MRVLVCGSRKYEDYNKIYMLLKQLPYNITLVHGAARGADSLAEKAARKLDLTIERHPAAWHKYGPAAGPIRNREMLDTNIDLVLAFRVEGVNSPGTDDLTGEAKRRGIEVKEYN